MSAPVGAQSVHGVAQEARRMRRPLAKLRAQRASAGLIDSAGGAV